MLKKSVGNMYPWVTHTHAHLGGECPHKCSYCYVDHPAWGRPGKYTGPLRLIENEFSINYGAGRTIFIENCNDLFAMDVPVRFIMRILGHCLNFPENTYVFQTKNPVRYLSIDSFARLENIRPIFPDRSIYGVTIESNRYYPEISKAPSPPVRMKAMVELKGRKFVTVEPILDFDPDILGRWIRDISPEFVNIGADSKGHNLPEPGPGKVRRLIELIGEAGIEIREKHNLNRLMRDQG